MYAKYSEDPRSLMFSNYISNVKFIDFFFGYNFYNDRYFNSLNFNPHNSFICLHYHIGIFTLPFLLFLICRLFYLLKYNRFLCVLVALFVFGDQPADRHREKVQHQIQAGRCAQPEKRWRPAGPGCPHGGLR